MDALTHEAVLGFEPPAFWSAQTQPQMFAKSKKKDEDDDVDIDDDDEDDDEDDDDDEDEDDEDDKGDKEKGALEKRLKETQARNKRLRAKLNDKKSGKDSGKKDEDEDDVEERINAARAEGQTAGEKRVVRVSARLALKEAGLTIDSKKALKLIEDELDDLDVDADDDEVEGLDDIIDAFKADNPEFFASKRRRGSADAGADRDGDSARDRGGRKKSTTEMQVEAAEKARRRSAR